MCDAPRESANGLRFIVVGVIALIKQGEILLLRHWVKPQQPATVLGTALHLPNARTLGQPIGQIRVEEFASCSAEKATGAGPSADELRHCRLRARVRNVTN